MKKFLVGLLAALACFAMVACVPGDLAKAEEKMEKAGYKVTVADGDLIVALYGEEVVGTVTATKTEGSGAFNTKVYSVTAILFENNAAAKFYAEDKEDVEVSGKWVFWGDESAVKAFKK